MKALKKTYSVKIGEENILENCHKMVVDLETNTRTYFTEGWADVDGISSQTDFPQIDSDVIDNIERLVNNDLRVHSISIDFDDGSHVTHYRSHIWGIDRVLVYTEKHGEYSWYFHNRETPNPDSEIYENELVWSLCWNEFPSHWINEHCELEQI